jgi:hypothetical protein
MTDLISLAFSDNSSEVIANLDQLPRKLQLALVEKMNLVIGEAHTKLAGALPSFKIDYGVEELGNTVIGYLEPAEPKAIAREFGGKSYYWIVPTKANLLRFIGTKDGALVHTPSVFHPPSREFRDIRNEAELAAEKLRDLIATGLL